MMHFLFLIIISLVILFSKAFFIDSHITLHNRFSALRSITGTSSEKGAENLNRRRNSHNFNDLINQGSKTGVYTAAVRAATLYLHDSNNKLTPSGLTSVIKIYGLSGNVDDAIDALSVAKNRHLNVNIKHINAVINVCKKHKRYEDALKIFEKATDEMSLQPDVASISSIISVLGNLNKWEQALTHFESIKLEERDQILFSSILSALDASGRGNECLAILASATDSSSNIKRTVHMYTSTISALGKIGDMYHVWKVYQQALQELGQVAKCDRILTYTVLKILDGAKMFEKAALVRQNSNCADTPMQTSAAAAATSLSTSTDKADVQFSSSAARGFEDSLSEDSSPSPPLPSFSFSDLIREARRSGDFRAAVAAADSWLGDSSR
jgi:pentatricopeptide repeat protein